MKTILLVSLGVILVVAVVVFRRWIRTFKSIRPILTVNPIYITPDLPVVKINTRKEDLFVREGLDFMKVSTKMIRDPKLLLFETYSPEDPDRKKKLVLAEYVGVGLPIDLRGGDGVIYIYSGTAYLGRSKLEQSIDSYYDSVDLITDNGAVRIGCTLVCGIVKKVYGDYKIEKKS